jgi:hypothetical protein
MLDNVDSFIFFMSLYYESRDTLLQRIGYKNDFV